MASLSSVPLPQLEDFTVKNETIHSYLKGSKERASLEESLKKYSNQTIDIPVVIGDEEIKSDEFHHQVMPHDHKKKLAKYHVANAELLKKAIANSLSVREFWENVPINEKIRIFQKAADLIAGKYRMDIMAATMLGQAKNVYQAEIDAAAEQVDFLRFNAYYVKETLKYSPISEDPKSTLNSLRYRGLEGFIAAISPFNFTAIGGNLATAPALMGNVVLWKPSDTAVLSNYLSYRAFREAGIPPGVINFVPADGPVFGDTITASPDLAGINFTGSVPTFRRLWEQVGKNLSSYKNFPRLVGECGGKNYHFVHPSADIDTVVATTIRSAFEYSGQKCSACSRMYVPQSIWPKVRDGMTKIRDEIKVGPPTDYVTFVSSVIDSKSFDRIKGYIEYALKSPNLTIIGGGKMDNSKGYFIDPTIIETKDPEDKVMKEEIFGPVLCVYPYPDKDLMKMIDLVSTTTPYALTGSVYAQDREFLKTAIEKLKMTAGNFYVNDKCTGAVVGQQPFGGGRLSGTNDKAGGPHYLLRWASPQTIKEAFVPLRDWRYPYMEN